MNYVAGSVAEMLLRWKISYLILSTVIGASAPIGLGPWVALGRLGWVSWGVTQPNGHTKLNNLEMKHLIKVISYKYIYLMNV